MAPQATETIRRINGYSQNAYTYYPVAIIGAGASGIAMGCRLKQELGLDQFRIFERQAGLGGTWHINRYPGIACDIPAIFYSFSFAQNPKWSSFYPKGREMVGYLADVCADFGITDKIQLNTNVDSCRWLEDEKVWELQLQHMVAAAGELSSKDRLAKIEREGPSAVFTHVETIRAKAVVSCVGGLVEPKGWPKDLPGNDEFKGEIFHSARWREDLDFNDKDVVIVGTGCSAAQIVPCLVKAPYNARSVTQLMRSPPWVEPEVIPPGGKKWWSANGEKLLTRVPGLMNTIRLSVAFGAEVDFLNKFKDGPYAAANRKKREVKLKEYRESIVPKKYHAMLTPDYSIGCKRRIWNTGWFESLNDPRVELTTHTVKSLSANHVTLTDPNNEGTTRDIPADIIVLANGYETYRWLHPLAVHGMGGKDLVTEMDNRGGPQAYQGTAFDGFPNFFMIFGPNTATGHSSVIMASENMVEYSLRFLRLLFSGDATRVDVAQAAETEYTIDIQRALKSTVFHQGGCASWYFRADGWNSTVLPYSQIWFWYRTRFVRWADWNIVYTAQGKRKLALRRIMNMALMVSLLFALARARRLGVKGMRAQMLATASVGLVTARNLIEGVAKQVGVMKA